MITRDEVIALAVNAGASFPIMATYQLQDEQIVRFAAACYRKGVEDSAKVAENCNSTDDYDPHAYCAADIRKLLEDKP